MNDDQLYCKSCGHRRGPHERAVGVPPYPVKLDGQMCEEIRIGIHARQAFSNKGYRRKDPAKRGPNISLSFSSTVLDVAGGFKRFLEEWEEDPSW